MFDELMNTWSENFEFKENDKPVKVAVLDTGLDLLHKDWPLARALRFENSQPVRDSREPSQLSRIKLWKDFCGRPESQSSWTDVDGHGTQVAGLILRIAPRAELYIARICVGNKNRGVSTDPPPPEHQRFRHPQPEVVAQAIDWAIEQEVDIINMSFGFRYQHGAVRTALRTARDKKILVFAAMSNDGNNNPEGAAWPARDPSLTIGVHSCREGGRKTSDFTPPHVPFDHNFMVVGEKVVTHWPEAKGGGFRVGDGTSFATPVVTAMAALILAFQRQRMCKKERAEAAKFIVLEELQEIAGMKKVLRLVSHPGENERYSYIHPRLLWKGFNLIGIPEETILQKRREHAWNVIREALSS
jgi:subtilisin family serine protease